MESLYKQASLIFNPAAGRFRRDPGLAERVRGELRHVADSVEMCATPGPLQGGTMARDAVAAGSDLILVLGGDGTVNEVAAGLVGSRVPLAVLPGGTANVLVNELGLPGNPLAVARKLRGFRPVDISAGLLCASGAPPRHFLMMAGAGLDAHIVHHMDPSLKRRWGKLSYWAGGFSQLRRRLDEFEAEVDGQIFRASFALVSRVRNYGGDLEIARRVTLLDNCFEVVLFEGANPWRYLKYFVGVGLKCLDRMSGVRAMRGSRVNLRPLSDSGAAVYVQVDGEDAGNLPAGVSLVPGALRLLVPESYRNRSGFGR